VGGRWKRVLHQRPHLLKTFPPKWSRSETDLDSLILPEADLDSLKSRPESGLDCLICSKFGGCVPRWGVGSSVSSTSERTSFCSPAFPVTRLKNVPRYTVTASEPRANNVKLCKDFYHNAKARIWPWLSDMCQIRWTADYGPRGSPPPASGPPSAHQRSPLHGHGGEFGTYKTVKARFRKRWRANLLLRTSVSHPTFNE